VAVFIEAGLVTGLRGMGSAPKPKITCLTDALALYPTIIPLGVL